MANPVTGPGARSQKCRHKHKPRGPIKVGECRIKGTALDLEIHQGSGGFTVALGVCMRNVWFFAKRSDDHRSEASHAKTGIMGPKEAFEDIGVL